MRCRTFYPFRVTVKGVDHQRAMRAPAIAYIIYASDQRMPYIRLGTDSQGHSAWSIYTLLGVGISFLVLAKAIFMHTKHTKALQAQYLVLTPFKL